MGVSLKPAHLARYKDIARLLLKRERIDLVRGDADADGPATAEDAEALASELEAMGPTFIKLGQLLSTRSDLLPPVYLQALTRLQDKVEPLSFAPVEEVVTGELGARLSKAFQEFESTPVASASLGQVHRAMLRDGRTVAVKVQRPGIKNQIVDDMDVIEEIAQLVDDHTSAGRRYRFSEMVAEFRRSLLDELDYRREAANLKTLGEHLAQYDRIVVPAPVDDYTTATVLTMDWIEGRNVASLTGLARLDLDGTALAAQLFDAYLDQILVHGFFHADPHPGNVLVTDDGRLGLIDLGMVARVRPETRQSLVKLLLAVSAGRGSDAADVMVEMGTKLDSFDRDSFRSEVADLVGRSGGATVGEVQAGAVLGDVLRAGAEAGLQAPTELTMLGKALLNLDEVARILDPEFEPNASIERHAAELMRRTLVQSASPSHVMAAAMEAKEFAEKLPGRVNKVMDALAQGELTLNVQGVDEREIMRSMQKLANRVTTGVVVASLVIGAALIMRVDAHPKLFGYPAIAIVLFLIAAAAGAGLLLSMFLSDLPQHRRRGLTGRAR